MKDREILFSPWENVGDRFLSFDPEREGGREGERGREALDFFVRRANCPIARTTFSKNRNRPLIQFSIVGIPPLLTDADLVSGSSAFSPISAPS